MAAEVSSMVREVSGYKEEGEGKKDLVTRDLLGGGGGEIDVVLQVPVGWERRLDILSGKTRNLKSGGSDPVLRELHDLNLPPPPVPPSGGTAIPEESSSLDLALSGTAARAAPASAYRSVCTLEKVKSALERAERESRWRFHLPADCGSSASPSSSTTSSSLKRRATEDVESAEAQESPSAPAGGMVAAGCPCCLLYVLISTADPRCPRCDSHVPVPSMKKKRPRIDLNSSSSSQYF